MGCGCNKTSAERRQARAEQIAARLAAREQKQKARAASVALPTPTVEKPT